jgi:hypothetical protein
MSKSETRTAAAKRRSTGDDDDDDAKEPQPRASTAIQKYRVRPGQTVQHADTEDGENVVIYGEGEEVDLTEAEAQAMPWAVELPDEKKSPRRSGQVSRLKRELQAKQQEMDRLKEENERLKNPDKDPNRKKAVESLLARGDNFIGRGEPDPDRVPREVVDAHDRRVLAEELGESGSRQAGQTDDELSGMKGMARETAGSSGSSSTSGPAGSHMTSGDASVTGDEKKK